MQYSAIDPLYTPNGPHQKTIFNDSALIFKLASIPCWEHADIKGEEAHRRSFIAPLSRRSVARWTFIGEWQRQTEILQAL